MMYRMLRWLLRKFGYELVTLKHVEECELCKSKHIEMLNAQRKMTDEYAKQLQIYSDVVNEGSEFAIAYIVTNEDTSYKVNMITRATFYGELRAMYSADFKDFITPIKEFRFEDYDTEEYARDCAQELCDKLNEKP